MRIDLITQHPKKKSSCLALLVSESLTVASSTNLLPAADQTLINTVLKSKDIAGKIDDSLLLQTPSSALTARILLAGAGGSMPLAQKDFRKIIATILASVKKYNLDAVTINLQNIAVKDQDAAWQLRELAIQCEHAFYEFNHYHNKPSNKKLESIVILVNDADKKLAAQGLAEGQAIAGGITLCKDLSNTPPNVCTPIYLAEAAKKLEALTKTQKNKIAVSSLDEKEMKKLGMGSLLSVSHGSNNPPRLIVLEYSGASKKDKPLTFVGKGITFDTGGNSLKSGEGMIGMKYDMCGGATVIGLVKAAAELQLPVNIVGVIAAAENMPGASATRPEDIVKSMSGQTIEILNTDAEGRLVLCDALTYCKKFNPAVVIDIATLTGAIMIALGLYRSGAFSNSKELSDTLFNVGEHCGDPVWPMPIDDEYNKLIDSKIADMQNIGKGKLAGSTTAACFLSRFTKDFTWAHLDVAGTATTESRTATGRPLPLLMNYVLQYCKNKKG